MSTEGGKDGRDLPQIKLKIAGKIFLFTEATRGGVTGLAVAKHVDGHGELSIALVHVLILRQQTKEEAAWEQTKKLENVTSVNVQFTVATRRGLVGLVVVSLVVRDWNTVPVPAQILGQHTEDEDVAALDQVEKGGVVTLSHAQFMAATRGGLIGLSVAGHVMEESKIVIVRAPTPCLRTEEKTAADWDKLKSQGRVTHTGAQFTVTTRSGPVGLVVASLVVWGKNTVFVPAQILGQHTEDGGVSVLDHGQNHGLVTFSCAQFMVDIRSGLIGLSVAGHVAEESNIVIVHAPIPRLQTEEETVVDWDELKSHGHVKNTGAQSMEGFQTGLPGLNVASHVEMELNSVIDRAPIHLLQTVENNAKDPLRNHKYAPMKCARNQLLEGIQTGLPGLSVVSHVVMELNSATDLATTRNLETMKQHARDLLRKHAYVPLKYVQHQFLDGFQTGLPGLSVVSHVVMELNSATDHAPSHLLQTMEHLAGVLQKNHEHVPLKPVTL